MRFLEVNVNPWKKKTGDCATRAVCQACNIPYKQAAKELFDEWMSTGEEMTFPKTIAKVLIDHGFERFGKPKHANNTTYSVEQLCAKYGKGNIIVAQVANHWTVIKDDKLIDLWDCSMKSVYGYFIKKAQTESELAVYGGEIKSSKTAKGRRTLL